MKNDVSFIVQNDMNVYAHQSTFNPNMPLRELMYVARLYDKYIHQNKQNIFSSKPIEIPVPRLIDDIRKYKKSGKTIEDAVDLALQEMPENSMIKPFLIANKAEVSDMCLTEYNEAETMELFKEEYLAEGRAEGREEGREEGVRSTVELCKRLGGSSLDAVENVVANMGFSRAEADQLVSKFW